MNKILREKIGTRLYFSYHELGLIINSQGELLSIKLTPGNIDDRKPIPDMCKGLVGQMFADRGYISKVLAEKLLEQGLELITTLRKNMKPVPRTNFEKAILYRRSLIETVIGELKNLCQIEHTRHRSITNFGVNLMAGIVAYCLSDNKPSLNLVASFGTMVAA